MNRTWQLAAAAVVGILILILGAAWLGGSQGGVGGPAPAATPSPIPSPTPTPQVLSSGDPVALEPGRRYAFPSLHFWRAVTARKHLSQAVVYGAIGLVGKLDAGWKGRDFRPRNALLVRL